MSQVQTTQNQKVVLITGAATGFGFLLVEPLLKQGHNVVATCRDLEQRKSEFADLSASYGDRLTLLELDVTDPQQRSDVVQAIGERFGRLDILINNAGFGQFGSLEDLDEDLIRRQFEVNFFGLAFLTRAALPLLRQSKGKIVMLSSVLGMAGMPLAGAYAASKFAVEGLSESLRYELAGKGVQICVVGPGGHRTKFAKNMRWPVASKSSPYKLQTEAYQTFMEKLSTGKPTNPEAVSRQIVALLSKKKMPFRVSVGRDAAMVGIMRKLLPHSGYISMTQKVFNKQFRTNDAG